MTDDLKSSSPVASATPAKKWQMLLLLALALAVIGIIIIAQHHTKTSDPVKTESAVQNNNFSPPQLSTVEQQLEQIQASIEKQPNASDIRDQDQEEAEKLQKMRMVAPTTVYSAASGTQASNQGLTKPNAGVLGGNGTGDENTQFMSRVSASSTPIVSATHIAHPATTLAQGTMIWATLETRIVSDLPGMVRAITSEDIYSEDGSHVLLPRGSKLVGQYTNGIAQGQQRVFVVWQRVIRPDHIDIQLNSPGTDALGAAGLDADSIDRHFFEQFGTASLLSIIGAGAANAGVSSQDQFNSASAYREAVANSFAQTAQNTLRSKGTINPTIKINQGKVFSVFVARDLDFDNELSGK